MARADGGQKDGTMQHKAGVASTFPTQTHFYLGTLGWTCLMKSVLATGEWATGTKTWKRIICIKLTASPPAPPKPDLVTVNGNIGVRHPIQ